MPDRLVIGNTSPLLFYGHCHCHAKAPELQAVHQPLLVALRLRIPRRCACAAWEKRTTLDFTFNAPGASLAKTR